MSKFVNVNGFDLPILKKEREFSSYSTSGAKYSFKKIGVSEVLHINTEFTYRTKYYYNLYDIKGNVIKTGIETDFENVKKTESVDDIYWFGGKKLVLFLNGEFRLLTINNMSVNTINELSEFNYILNFKYKTYAETELTPFDCKMDFVPHYNIIRGHSRNIFGIFSREDIKMTYKDLKLKIKVAKELYKNIIKYDIDKDFEEMENEIINSLSKYLMLTPKQYKASRYNLINQLNKRLNYNINNKK